VPHAFKLQSSEPNYKIIFAKVLDQWFFLLIVIGTVLSLFAAEVLRLLTPESYWGASGIFSFLVMGVVVYGTALLSIVQLLIEKKTRLIAIISWVIAGLNISLNYFLIPYYGAVGAAAASFLSNAILSLMLFYFARRHHPINFNWGLIGLGYVLVIGVLISSVVLENMEWGLHLLPYKLLIVILVILLPMLLGVFGKDDINKTLEAVRNFLKI
jgi:O-antigen/teichoic acid export membrane protein